RASARETSMRNIRSLQLAWMMYAQNSTNRPATGRNRSQNGSTEDHAALAKERQPSMPSESLGNTFYTRIEEMLEQMPVKSSQLPQCTKIIPRLTDRDWHLTKFVRAFAPPEMRDLEFEPAIPSLARVLS